MYLQHSVGEANGLRVPADVCPTKRNANSFVPPSMCSTAPLASPSNGAIESGNGLCESAKYARSADLIAVRGRRNQMRPRSVDASIHVTLKCDCYCKTFLFAMLVINFTIQRKFSKVLFSRNQICSKPCFAACCRYCCV